MEFLLFYLATVGAGYFMTLSTMFKMVRDIGDSGYKLNAKKFSELSSMISPEQKKINTITRFLPLVNILAAFKAGVDYVNNRDDILYELSLLNAIEEMTDKEKEEYSKHPTALKCFLITIESEAEKDRPNRTIEIKSVETEQGEKLIIKGESEARTYDKEEIARFLHYGLNKYKDPRDFIAAYKEDGKKVYEEFLEYSSEQEKKAESKESNGPTLTKKNNGIK